jgi:hypothetical protein
MVVCIAICEHEHSNGYGERRRNMHGSITMAAPQKVTDVQTAKRHWIRLRDFRTPSLKVDAQATEILKMIVMERCPNSDLSRRFFQVISQVAYGRWLSAASVSLWTNIAIATVQQNSSASEAKNLANDKSQLGYIGQKNILLSAFILSASLHARSLRNC